MPPVVRFMEALLSELPIMISGAGDIQSQTFPTLLGSRTLAFGVLLFNLLMVADVFTSEDIGLKLTYVSMYQALCPQTCE